MQDSGLSKIKKDLSIIIINWNSKIYLKSCLKSIFDNTKNLKFEVIVVDNASYDGCERYIKTKFSNVIFVQSKENLGFSGGNNLGVSYASGNNFLFLNPDTEIIGPAINKMYFCLNNVFNAGAVGCKLLNSDYSIQTSCILPFHTAFNQLFEIDLIKKIIFYLRFNKKPKYLNNCSVISIDAVSGACLMVKRDVFKLVGEFSNDYFMYAEDVDLCYKIKRANYHVYCIRDASVLHHSGKAVSEQKSTKFVDVLMRESKYIFIKKHRGYTSAVIYKNGMIISSIIRIILIKLIHLIYSVIKIDTNYILNIEKKWKNILRWSLGYEEWAKVK